MTITICGSLTFAKQMKKIKDFLERKRHQVFVPPLMNRYLNGRLKKSKIPEKEAEKKRHYNLIRIHFEAIKKSDAILVLNYKKNKIEGFIGGNTFLEMGFAHVLDKKIYLLNPIPKMDYTSEILAMKPIVLNGDLKKLR